MQGQELSSHILTAVVVIKILKVKGSLPIFPVCSCCHNFVCKDKSCLPFFGCSCCYINIEGQELSSYIFWLQLLL